MTDVGMLSCVTHSFKFACAYAASWVSTTVTYKNGIGLVHILLHIFENEIENVPCRFFRSMNHAVLCQGVIQLDEYLIDERQDGLL